MSFKIEYQVDVSAENIRAISTSLRAFFNNFEELADTAFLLELAIAEGMNNVLEHAYVEGDAGIMRIVIQFEDLNLTISIFDQGDAPDYALVSSAPSLVEFSEDHPVNDELSSEGRGLVIMESLMDSLKYKRIGNENCLMMTKTL